MEALLGLGTPRADGKKFKCVRDISVAHFLKLLFKFLEQAILYGLQSLAFSTDDMVMMVVRVIKLKAGAIIVKLNGSNQVFFTKLLESTENSGEVADFGGQELENFIG